MDIPFTIRRVKELFAEFMVCSSNGDPFGRDECTQTLMHEITQNAVTLGKEGDYYLTIANMNNDSATSRTEASKVCGFITAKIVSMLTGRPSTTKSR